MRLRRFGFPKRLFFEPSAMYNNNQNLLDVYDIMAAKDRKGKKIKKLKFTIDKHIHLC